MKTQVKEGHGMAQEPQAFSLWLHESVQVAATPQSPTNFGFCLGAMRYLAVYAYKCMYLDLMGVPIICGKIEDALQPSA